VGWIMKLLNGETQGCVRDRILKALCTYLVPCAEMFSRVGQEGTFHSDLAWRCNGVIPSKPEPLRKAYMGQEVTREELLERVQQIAPVIREHVDHRVNSDGKPRGSDRRGDSECRFLPDGSAARTWRAADRFGDILHGGRLLGSMDRPAGACLSTAAPPSRRCFCKTMRPSPSSTMELTLSCQAPCFLLAGRCHVTAAIGSRSAETMQAGVGIPRGASGRLQHL